MAKRGSEVTMSFPHCFLPCGTTWLRTVSVCEVDQEAELSPSGSEGKYLAFVLL